MSGKEGEVRREQVEGQTATGMQKETFGSGAAARAEAGRKGGERAKELGAGVMESPEEFGRKGGLARGKGGEEKEEEE